MASAEELKKQVKEYGLESLGIYYGIYRGFIADNKDPEFMGRVQLKVPQIFGEGEVLDYWAWSKGMYCGTDIGLFAIPNIGDMVWVSFEGGNPSYPVWEYGHFAKTDGTSDIPTDWNSDDNNPTPVILQTKAGHRLEFINKEGEELVRLKNKQGYSIEMNKNGTSIVTPTGKKINLGTLDGAAEPALLGDKTEKVLNDIKGLLQSIAQMLSTVGTADTAAASSYGFTFAGTFTSTATQMVTDIATLVTDIQQIKSQKVTLD